MDTQTFKKSLVELTDQLLYSSESDYPFEILNWNKKSVEEVKQAITAEHAADSPITSMSCSDFFNKIIRNLENSGNDVMLSVAERYKRLKSFLTTNSKDVSVLRCGNIQVGVYIVAQTNGGEIVVLKTTSIET